MAHYFCIATGLADFTPTSQDYHSAETESDFHEILKTASEAWQAELDGEEFYSYEFRMPREGESNYSQRLLIAAGEDYVLDVIGMTAEEFERESGE